MIPKKISWNSVSFVENYKQTLFLFFLTLVAKYLHKKTNFFTLLMKIDYNNLYTHFVFTVFERQRNIPEKNRVRIEKYITGIVSRNNSKLYAI